MRTNKLSDVTAFIFTPKKQLSWAWYQCSCSYYDYLYEI